MPKTIPKMLKATDGTISRRVGRTGAYDGKNWCLKVVGVSKIASNYIFKILEDCVIKG